MPALSNPGRLAPVCVLDVELTAPAAPTLVPDGCVEAQALLRRGGVPVGWVALPVERGRVPAEALQRAAERHPNGRTGSEAMTAGTLPSVTVAVCTRDRPDELRRCLEALERLDLPGVELLVVDNAPGDDATERLVRTRHPRVRYAREPAPGLDHARNRAILESAGEVLAFTDDDVVVDPAWARALATAFASDPEAQAVMGLVLPLELETEAQVLFERYRSFARGFVPMRVRAEPGTRAGWLHGNTGRLGTGANMAFRRAVFDRVGPFDPALGGGTAARGGDDLEMLFRLIKAGHAVRYEPQAMVWHRHRRSLEELRAQMRDCGVGFSASLVRSARAYPGERGALARLWTWWAAKLVYRSVAARGRPRGSLRGLALAELQGVLLGLRRYGQVAAALSAEAGGTLHTRIMEGT